MPGLDPSIYNQLQAPPSPIDTFAKYQGIANSIIQNQLMGSELPIRVEQAKQAAITTQQQQAEIDSSKYIANPKYDGTDGITKNWNGMMADAAKNSPLAVPLIMAKRDAYLTQVPAGVDPQSGAPQNAPLQEVLARAQGSNSAAPAANVNQPQPNGVSSSQPSGQPPSNNYPHAMPMGLAPAVAQQIQDRTDTNQQYVTDTRAAAADAPNQITMLDKIKNLAQKTQTGPYADRINKFRAGLAEIFGTDPNSPATYEQLNKYMLANGLGQAAQNGANSDARTLAYVNSNPNTGILPEAVLPLAQYQQALYRQKMGEANGLEKSLSQVDPNQPAQLNPTVENYRANYRNNTNAQFYEYKNLPDAEAKKTFIATHPGFAAQADKMKKIKALGALD